MAKGASIGRGEFLRQLFQGLYGGTGREIAAPLPDGKLLVHYTNLGTLIEIARNNDLWMTDARYSNDRQEIVGGLGAVRTRVKAKLRREASFYSLVNDWLTRREENRFYVTCFCTESDLLSQWRAYGADGEGVSISMDGHELSRICHLYKNAGAFILAPVVYEDAKKNELVDKVLEIGRTASPNEKEQARVISFALTVFAATFKSPLFAEEAEWRLIFMPTTSDDKPNVAEIHFRARRDLLVPFVKLRPIGDALGNVRFKMAKLPIRRVRLGPSLQPTRNTESVELLLNKHGFDPVSVRHSRIPYRRQ